jgi:uncharacterized protein with PIN domain
LGNITYPTATGYSGSTVIQSVRDREYVCPCGEPLMRKRLTTKAKKVGRYYEIEAEKTALCCAKCGPVAWEA